ncbi:1215_t:CDS:1, partial [Diversispora eburnea]
MAAAIFPVLCLKNIFHHLSELDHQSQRTCVMLNRHWCSNLTSELWRNPFDFFLEDEKKVKLIDIYLKCLPRDVQKRLNLPMINKNYNKTAFNYPSFLHEFDPELILDFIRKWENKNMKFKKSTK